MPILIKHEEHRSDRAIEFLKAIADLCVKYNRSIGHEDFHGSFIVEEFSENNQKWLLDAVEEVEDTEFQLKSEPKTETKEPTVIPLKDL